MIHKMSIGVKITVMVVLILTICAVGLTIIINFAASHMVTEVAMEMAPAMEVPIGTDINTIDDGIINASVSDEVNVQNIKNSFYLKSILGMIGIIALGGVSCFYIIKKSLNPLTKLNKQIQNMGITDLAKDIEIPASQDEVTEIAKSFNDMTKKLNEAFNFQNQFSANVAHELRTPLTVLKTKIGVFNKKREHSEEEYKELISNLEKQITQLSTIIQNLLEITSTDVILEKEVINISDIINDIIDELAPIIQVKNICIKTEYNDIEVYGNIDLLYRAFYNIIENGIKYNNESGIIEITADKYDNKNIIIKIKDTGIGVPKEMQKNIFEPFYRVDKSRSREIGGVGLGLSIVRNIIEKHNGKINVSNNIPQGSVFSIILPKK